MKVGFQLVLYILLLNLVCGLVYGLGVPGTEFSTILYGTGNATEYQERMNASEFMEGAEPEASNIFTFAGTVWGGLQLVWNVIRFTILGLPNMLWTISYQIANPEAKVAFMEITGVVLAVEGFIVFMWLFQLLSGRQVED